MTEVNLDAKPASILKLKENLGLRLQALHRERDSHKRRGTVTAGAQAARERRLWEKFSELTAAVHHIEVYVVVMEERCKQASWYRFWWFPHQLRAPGGPPIKDVLAATDHDRTPDWQTLDEAVNYCHRALRHYRGRDRGLEPGWDIQTVLRTRERAALRELWRGRASLEKYAKFAIREHQLALELAIEGNHLLGENQPK